MLGRRGPPLARFMSTIELLVLGSGPSTSIPSIRCLVSNADCRVCSEAHANPNSKNRRLNPSLFVKYAGLNLLIDCGKTFREGLMRVVPQHEIYPLDAVVLTHGHADACFGLDDLRDVQAKLNPSQLAALPIYCSRRTRQEIEPKFGYLFEPSDPSVKSQLWTAKLQWREFDDMTSFRVCDKVVFNALAVWHGHDYLANGFEFGFEIGRRIVYISDVSRLTEETLGHLRQGVAIDILFLDALHVDFPHGTHMSLNDAKATIQELRPVKTYLVGMGHTFDFNVHQPWLQTWKQSMGIDVEMAYDGLHLVL
ncbi:unnamed protein product [Aphanomyces euteiches]